MKSLDHWLTRISSSYVTISVVGFLTLIIIMCTPWLIPSKDLTSVLQSLAPINITVAIGMGTIAIAMKEQNDVTTLVKEIILLMLISVLSFFISFLDVEIIKRAYILVSGLVLLNIIIGTTRFLKDQIDSSRSNNKRNEFNKNTKRKDSKKS